MRDLPIRRPGLLRQHPDFPEQVQGLSRSDPPPKWIIIAAEPITHVDTTAADMLLDLDLDLDVALNDDGVNLVFAEMKDPAPQLVTRSIATN